MSATSKRTWGPASAGPLRLPFDSESAAPEESRLHALDREGRERAVDPRFNVALEASAGTGKTRVLVDRYINLLRAGVDPSNILAITFTRKAAAEMRERILATLRAAAAEGSIAPSRWRELRDRTADIAISTIDAFCLSLLREFPLEADLDPGFSLADETEVPRLIDASLDRALRICRALAREDDNIALVFAQLGDRRVRRGLAALLNRRLVAGRVLRSFLARGPADLTVARVTDRAAVALSDVFAGLPGGLEQFLETGPPHHQFQLVARDLRGLAGADPEAVHRVYARVRELFLTQDGEPRKALDRAYAKAQFPTEARWRTFRDAVLGAAGSVLHAWSAYRRDLNVLVAHGTWRMYRIAEGEYRRTLDSHAVLDFSDVLLRALDLLRQMEEFAQSRFRLESRYHHVLVDEFQDTSRPQWELISLLVASWGEGAGLAHSGPLSPTIFIVGDRKQSIYGFRDADVSLLKEAARHLEGLRPDGDVRRSISRSFRAVPPLLAFVNDVCHDVEKFPDRRDAFAYEEPDRFPIDGDTSADSDPALGIIAADSPEECARIAAAEIARLIDQGATVRDRETGVYRAATPGDIAILFRTRESHREFEDALDARGIPSYVYKGLGFFDADEVKDVLALLWYLAEPLSNLRAAAFLRSRFVKLPDEALSQLAPHLAAALLEGGSEDPPLRTEGGSEELPLRTDDRERLAVARQATSSWRDLVDRLPPAELLDRILVESGYAAEMRGPRLAQARENLKKLRALIRRIQNRGYSTLGRIAAHLDRLAVGDESNASIDALDAVSLMTVHAAKGLEFPIVFLVNLARGTGNRRDPIRVAIDPAADAVSVAVGDFQSDADEDKAAREREESKRLLYVALTRARDRLYLASAIKEGRIQPGRGSLAEVLPPTLLEQFSEVGSLKAVPACEWKAASGARHVLRVCADADSDLRITPRQVAAPAESDFEPLSAPRTRRQAIPEPTVDASGSLPRFDAGSRSDRLVGTVVHRLLQMRHLPADGSGEVKRAAARSLRPEEVVHIEDEERFAHDVARAYATIAARSDVQAHYAMGNRLHEVPFSLRAGDTFVRGTIDCLIRSHQAGETERVAVLEFKTGQRRPEHQQQLEVYARAARALFPGAMVTAELVYAE